MANGPQYYGTIPNIAQAYQNDPRTKLAASALATGTSTAPVALGGWAATDGLARAAQAVLGAVLDKKQQQKYAAREQQYTKDMQAAAGTDPQAAAAGTPPPAPVAPAPAQQPAPPPPAAIDAASAALSPAGPQSPQMPQSAPAGPIGGLPPGMTPNPVLSASSGAPSPDLGPFGSGGTGPNRGAEPRVQVAALYRNGIVPIEGGTDPRTGAFRTSPKGAIGPGQLMPKTAPEAAKLAGLPYDENKLRSDPEYNNALGQAYYAQQLKTFGDPIVAAAAYNAGPGGVRRAFRKARASGGSWIDHLPAETQKYVENFQQRVQGVVQSVEADMPLPQLEPVPDGVQAPGQRPDAPALAEAVQSRHMAVAQRLLATGNPDLMALAQTYLDKGLDEQFNADQTRNQQQFERENIGYRSGLEDFNNQSQAFRTQQANDRSSAQTRNYGREEQYRTQKFNREERLGSQSFTAGENAAQRTFTGEQNEKDRQNALAIAKLQQEGKYTHGVEKLMGTVGGQKIVNDTLNDIGKIDQDIANVNEFLELASRLPSGGIHQNGVVQWFDRFGKDANRFDQLSKDLTLGKLGGKLGTAISDGDRQFIAQSNGGLNSTPSANQTFGTVLKYSLQRSKDLKQSYLDALADGRVPQFTKEWKAYINDKNNQLHDLVTANKPYMSFDDWRSSRPQFDAKGNKVN